METLPLELHEQIFAYLLSPRDDWINIEEVPVSGSAARAHIYRLRLTSRRVNRAALQPFAQIIGDVPTKCTQESLRRLGNLFKLTDVGMTVTCLTFDVCKLYVTEKQTLTQVMAKCERQDGWIRDILGSEILAILHKTPRLRHLICRFGAMHGLKELAFEERQTIGLERSVRAMSDPLLYIQHALETANITQTLETMTILKVHVKGFSEAPPIPHATPPIDFPMLKHLTLSPSCSEVSEFRANCPNLASLHLILDNPGNAFDTASAERLPVHNIQPGLQSLTLSGDGYWVNGALLLQCIVPATTKIACLPLLTIRNMMVVMDVSYGVERLPGEGRFKKLLFEDVKYCFTDEITLSGPSDPVELDSKWKALPRLCERADSIRWRINNVERVMERYVWEDSGLDH